MSNNMWNVQNLARIPKQSQTAEVSEKEDLNQESRNRRSKTSMKFYVSIPIAEVGVVVLEQVIIVDCDEEGEGGCS